MPTVLENKKIFIPEVSKEEIRKRYKRIRPVVQTKNEKRYMRKVDLFATSFLWNPKPVAKAKGLEQLQDIETYHSYGAPAFFKPTIAEVLAQIPDDLLKQNIVAFEVVSLQSMDEKGREALNAGYHLASVRLYTLKK